MSQNERQNPLLNLMQDLENPKTRLDEYIKKWTNEKPVSYTHLDVYKRQRMNLHRNQLLCVALVRVLRALAVVRLVFMWMAFI